MWRKPDVRVGQVTVSAGKEGYETRTETVDLTEAGREVSFTLLQRTGALRVHCAPAECEVRLNDGPSVRTVKGEWEKPLVPLGNVDVSVAKEGYVSQVETVAVTGAPLTEVSVTLQPDHITQAANGKKLLAHMLDTLGMDSRLKNFLPLTGSGAITYYADGKPSEWKLDFGIGTPSLIEMTATSAAGSLTYRCDAEGCSETKARGLQPDVADKLKTNLGAFAKNHLGPLLQSLVSASAQPESPTADEKPLADQRLSVSDYDVTLGPDFQPKGFRKPGRDVSFSDYRAPTVPPPKGRVVQASPPWLDRVRYPMLTTIHLSGADQRGVVFKLDKVEWWSTYRAGDLAR
jgi:hypothetical protein